MFSERWICFCCPHTYKTRRSIVPIEQSVSNLPQQPMSSFSQRRFIKKKSDVSKIFFFIKIQLIILFEALSAVLIIQSWFRRRQAIFEIRRKAAWTIYQNIEYAGEQDQLKVINSWLDLCLFL